MLKVYKSGTVEISGERFAIRAELPQQQQTRMSPAVGQATTSAEQVDELVISDGAPVTLDPQAIETIFNDAYNQAAQIVAAAQQQASTELSAAREQARQEATELRSDAYREGQAQGYAEGAAAKVAAIEQTISRLEQVVAEIEGGFEGFVAEYESNLKWAVAEVSGKVLSRMIERDELELIDTVKTAVEQVRGAEWIDLHLARESTELIDRLKRELAPLTQLEIVPSDLPPGSCVLDIPSGKLDASIAAQLDNLCDYFRSHTLDL